MSQFDILMEAAAQEETARALLGLAETAPKKSKRKSSKRKSSKRTSPLKPYEVAMLLSACGGGHVNPKDAVDEARGYLVGMRCPSGMEKTKTGGCRKTKQKPTLKERETECKKKEGKRWTGKRCIKMRKKRKTKPRNELTEEDCTNLGKVLNRKTGRCNQKKRKTKPRKTKKQKPTLEERETECKKKEGKRWTGKRCIKMRKERRKTKRAPSVYNLFVQEVMPQIEDLSSKEKMKKVGDLWRQPGVKRQFYADKGVPMPSRRKTLAEREVECKAAGKRWTGKRCIKQKLTADEDDAAQEHDPNWWLKRGLVPPMWDEDASIDDFIDDDAIEDDDAFHHWFRSLSQNVKARYLRDDNFATQLRADYARQQVVDVDLQNEYGISV